MKSNLKDILDLRQITQAELSRNTGITKSAINRYIKNERLPNVLSALKIAKYLDLDVKDIWGF